jgi:uncharacterized protein YcbK (DUF882 family)
MQLTKNFNSVEFDCKDGTKVPKYLLPNLRRLAKNLQVLRDELGVPIHILSGYRTVKHNKAIGGRPASMHLKAIAADMACKEYTAEMIQNKIEELIKEGKMQEGGLGKYKTFTHYDVRNYKARW